MVVFLGIAAAFYAVGGSSFSSCSYLKYETPQQGGFMHGNAGGPYRINFGHGPPICCPKNMPKRSDIVMADGSEVPSDEENLEVINILSYILLRRSDGLCAY